PRGYHKNPFLAQFEKPSLLDNQPQTDSQSKLFPQICHII
ncbi:uncharacterized protein METZ01_LOCUS118310, partial [marine metagenome]